VDRLVAAVVAWAHRRRIVIAGLVAAALLASIEGTRRLSFDADVLSLLPRDSPVIQAFRTFLARFGSLDQLYVVFTAPEGHAIADYRDDVDEWIDQLRHAPEIARVDAAVVDRARDFSWLADRELFVLRDRSLDDALQRLTPDGLRSAVAARRELLTMPSPEIAAMVRQDPAGLFDLARDALGEARPGVGANAGADGYVTEDGRKRLLIARPSRPPYDNEFSRALDARLHDIDARVAASSRSRGADDDERRPPMQVQFAGGHRIAVETEAVVKREAIWNTVGSLIVILPLLYVTFRSFWLVTVGSLPTALSLVIVLGAIGFTGARLSAAATGAAAMLFGLGVDGVVLLYVAHRLALAENPDTDVPRAIAGPSSSMLLGMWTTAATFYGLMFVDFPSLQQLGRLLGHSMVVCGLLTLILVPALLPRRPSATRVPALRMPGLATWIARRRNAVLVAALAATLILGAAAVFIRINPTLDKLRSVTDAAQLETTIASAFGLPKDVYLVLGEGRDLESMLQANERLVTRIAADVPGVAVHAPSQLLPSAPAQSQTAQRIVDSGVSAANVRLALEQARTASGFTTDAFDPFSKRLPTLLNPSERLSYDGYISHGLGDLIDRFIVRDGDRWTLATYVFPVSADQVSHVQAIVDASDDGQTFTGLPLVNRELARSFVPQFLRGLIIGTIIVVVLVVIAFRSVRLSALAMLPTIVGLIWAAGALAIAGVELDLFAVFAVVTFVGIGVDYGIHLVHRFRERGDAERATAELAPVILVAAAITMAGYGTLVWSSYPPLRSIGIVSAVSVVTLAAASVFVLPALLQLEERR